jgi:hypothetical protein
VRKGDELGWFEHGSTIIVFAPRGFSLAEGIETGCTIRMGQALLCSRAATNRHRSVIEAPQHGAHADR